MKRFFLIALWGVVLLNLAGCQQPQVMEFDPPSVTETGETIFQEGTFRKPPKVTLTTPEGEVSLSAAGYHWLCRLGNGLEEAVIADQTGRPLPRESLESVTVDSQSAQTVYAPVPGGDTVAPTNSTGYLVKLHWEANPTSVTYTCWPESVWEKRDVPEETVVSREGAFYARPGGYVYEIAATWQDTGAGYHGSANYYVYIVQEDLHTHATALTAQTVDDPVTGYCGNTSTTLYIKGKKYSFMYGNSVALTDILINLDYNPDKVCRCMGQYRADTEFGANYQIHLDYGFVRCDKGQADLTQEQIDVIAQIVQWAETTNCQYPEWGKVLS